MPSNVLMRKLSLVLAALALAAAGCSASYCRSCPKPTAGPPAPEELRCGNFGTESRQKLEDVIARGSEAPRILMISGGGSYGAWGSGFLNGWSENATQPRPKFDLVTGSSTGAILGTWAFLGTPADKSARCAYTNTENSDVFKPALLSLQWLQPWNWAPRDWRAVRPWVSLKNLKPLRHLFEVYTPMSQVEEVGRIYKDEGRMFVAGTVDINLGTFCLWDMGKLGQEVLDAPPEQKKAKYAFYREVVMASSSNPGIFNPTMLDGDMHVDGGVRFQIFLHPEIAGAIKAGMERWTKDHKGAVATSAAPAKLPIVPLDRFKEADLCNIGVPSIRPRLYGIINMPMSVPRTCTKENIYNVAQRALTVTQIQAMIGNLFEARWQLDNEIGKPGMWDFCLTQIPYEYQTWPFADEFPECEMRKMYDVALERGKSEKPWNIALPGNEFSPHPCIQGNKCRSEDKCEEPAPGCGGTD
jgi:hypothetical protein